MFSKVLVANRGEIAIRAFRAAYEVGARTVAVFPHEDRWSEHRLKADEAYEIGERGHPVRAYLDPDAIVAVAVRAGADAVYPGYGFLSENPALAEACANAGITFVGPTAEVLTLTGNKARAIAAAKAAGVPTLASVEPSTDVDALVEAAAELPYPLFVKAVAGGGGRGMRRVDDPTDLREAVETCMREAEGAFGDPTVFIEQAVVDPRHIEVQILADGEGNVIHLFERDCSVQRRHQKVVEIAPAPQPRPRAAGPDVRRRGAVRPGDRLPQRRHRRVPARPGRQLRLHRDEPAHPGRAHGDRGGHRRRPRAVAAADRLRRDARGPRALPGRRRAARRRAAVPDHHRGPGQQLPARHRQDHDLPLPRRPGIRVDGGTTYTGAEVSAHFDSMLAKLTCRGRTFEKAVEKARRAVAEFRIRGVSTNIAFLQAVLEDPDFAGRQHHHLVHRDPPAAARRPRPGRPRQQAAAPTSPTSPSTSRTARRR